MDTSVLLLLLVCISPAFTDNVGSTSGNLPSRPASAWNATWTDRLKKDLLFNYDRFARPAEHTNWTVVKLDMTLRHVTLDEISNIMTVQAWLRLTWIDEKLKWNDSDYGGLNVLHVANHEIWQPDIVLSNSATANVDYYGNTHCLVYPNGVVLWVPPTEFQVFCDLDLRLWPFDTQSCYLNLRSWTYDADTLQIQVDVSEADMDDFIETSSEWEVEGTQMSTKSFNVKPVVTCKLTLRRRSPAYSAIVVTPATVIVLLTLASFWLPPTAGEKILINGCTAVIICMFLLYFAQKLPAMAGYTPLVVLFYSSSLYLVCIATIVSVVVVNLARNQYVTPLPWFIKNLLSGWLGQILGLGYLTAQGTSPDHNITGHAEELREEQTSGFEDHDHMGNSCDDRQMISPRPRATSQHDWVLLAAAIDRITFLVYCFLFAILAIVYAV